MGTKIVQIKWSDADQLMLRILKERYGIRTDAGILRFCLAAVLAGQVPLPRLSENSDESQVKREDESHDT